MDHEVFHVHDPRTLKAVAHPLRVLLLGELRTNGPATATELAGRLGESSGSTSYHLRQLVRYGFVEADPGQRDRRERRWRAIHRFTAWSDVEMAATAEGRGPRRSCGGASSKSSPPTSRTSSASATCGARRGPRPPASDLVVRLSPATVTYLYERMSAMLLEAAERDRDDPDARPVAVLLAAHPHRDPAAGHG
ncbi:hypothetical protein GCM10027612_88040 [Microbispora bryophytorum subsp. camponoti]